MTKAQIAVDAKTLADLLTQMRFNVGIFACEYAGGGKERLRDSIRLDMTNGKAIITVTQAEPVETPIVLSPSDGGA